MQTRLLSLAVAFAAASIVAFSNAALADDYTIEKTNGANGTISVTSTTFDLVDPSDTIQGLGSGTLQISGDFNGNAQYTDNVTATLATGTRTIDLISGGYGFFSIFGAYPISFLQADSNGDDLSYSTGALTSTSTNQYTFTAGGGSYSTPAPECGTFVIFTTLLASSLCVMLRKQSKLGRTARGTVG